MADDVYEKLADALDKLPNGFPRTRSNVEILILKKIFSLDEASLVCQLTGKMESVELIAEQVGLPVKEVKVSLIRMAKKGLVWTEKSDVLRFRLAPFIVGIYEEYLENMDHEFAHLFEEYMATGGAAGIMKPQPALHRVIPAQGTVKSEWILPYDDVRGILMSAKTYSVRDCICRVQQDYFGHRKCGFPLKNCLNFSAVERPPRPDSISQEEALAILDQAEQLGLVHAVSNITKGFFYVCNCCGCCCGILRGINEWGIDKSIAKANYYAAIDPAVCQWCGICIERCQVRAISEQNGIAVVDRKRCIGCGLCVTGCPNEASILQQKPDAETVHPPVDFAAWERARLIGRGLND